MKFRARLVVLTTRDEIDPAGKKVAEIVDLAAYPSADPNDPNISFAGEARQGFASLTMTVRIDHEGLWDEVAPGDLWDAAFGKIVRQAG